MRRRLILVSVAVTTMVVIAFLVPLSILVSDLARESAVTSAERAAESLARVLSVLSVDQETEDSVETIGVDRIVAVNGSVILPDGDIVGLPVPEDEDLSPAQAGSSFVGAVDGGLAVYVPVLATNGEVAVVRVFVPDADVTAGVARSRFILGLLGVALIVIAAWVADRLGRSMVVPVRELSDAAIRLGSGDLSARVEPAGPPEIEEVGIEFNRLAQQIGRLLQEERESAADLAHRLRTPLTAARLSVDGLDAGMQKDRLIADLDELQRTTDFLIREARRPVRREEEEWCDLAVVTRERAAFWQPLASEQGREVVLDITGSLTPIAIPGGDTEVLVDALIENVLSHTPDGAGFNVSVEVSADAAVLCVEDAGRGFVDGSAIERGASRGDSTGLGLDIVRRTVEGSGGTLEIGESLALKGAGIVVTLPLASSA